MLPKPSMDLSKRANASLRIPIGMRPAMIPMSCSQHFLLGHNPDDSKTPSFTSRAWDKDEASPTGSRSLPIQFPSPSKYFALSPSPFPILSPLELNKSSIQLYLNNPSQFLILPLTATQRHPSTRTIPSYMSIIKTKSTWLACQQIGNAEKLYDT